ncbi:MAG: CBS domain-containing protein [Gaiellales bacterium]
MIDRPVSDVMDQDTPTVTADTTTGDLVRLLAERGLDGVAVLDADGCVAGIVTGADLLYQEVEADEDMPYYNGLVDWAMGVASLGSWERHVEKAFAVTVADLMTAEVHTATVDTTVHEAAKLMAHEDVSQLPVLTDDGRYAGMLTRVGVVRALDRFEFGGGAG